jgi:hypothetical protein
MAGESEETRMYSVPEQGLEGFEEALAAATGCSLFIMLLTLVFMLVLFWRILSKAGYSGWLTLLNLIPFGTLALLLLLAFGSWPVFRDRNGPPAGGTGTTGYPPPYQPPSPPEAPGVPREHNPPIPPVTRP